MSAVLSWLKGNLASVIFFVVMIAAAVSLPLVASSLNEKVRSVVKDRVSSLDELRKLEKTNISISRINATPISETNIVNERLLERYREVVEDEREDAERLRTYAIEHNRKSRGVLLPRLFPDPPPAEREVLPQRFHGDLMAAYDQLLATIGAGDPPSMEMIAAEIDGKRSRFYSQTLQKDLGDALTGQEETKLREAMARERMILLAREADDVLFYASTDALALPPWEQANQPGMFELFDWQWQYWIIEDVLRGLAAANPEGSAVSREPLKRVIEVTVQPDTNVAAAGGGGGGGGLGGGGLGGGGLGGGSRGGGRGAAPPKAAPINPAAEVKLDYSGSFTGRMTNPLYDVRRVNVRLIVETAGIGTVVDALARRNFITILDMQVRPADQYAAAKEGYYYGQEPISEVTLELETVWLREWTREFMPAEVKQALGVADPAAAPQG